MVPTHGRRRPSLLAESNPQAAATAPEIVDQVAEPLAGQLAPTSALRTWRCQRLLEQQTRLALFLLLERLLHSRNRLAPAAAHRRRTAASVRTSWPSCRRGSKHRREWRRCHPGWRNLRSSRRAHPHLLRPRVRRWGAHVEWKRRLHRRATMSMQRWHWAHSQRCRRLSRGNLNSAQGIARALVPVCRTAQADALAARWTWALLRTPR